MTMSAAFIFDLDGVVIDSKAVIEAAFAQAFLRHFPDLAPPTHRFFSHMGKGLRQILEELRLPLAMADDFVECSTQLEHQIRPFAGMPELLSGLKAAGAYVGLATGKERMRTLRILRDKDLLRHFCLVVCSDDVPRGKPDPASIDAHVSFGGLDRRTTYFLGDALSDVRCAVNSRVWPVAALWGGITPSEVLLNEKPAFHARSVAEASKLFLKLARDASWADIPYAHPIY